MNELLNNFHFIRPWCLWALVPAIFFIVMAWRRQRVQEAWKGVIKPHLFKHLLIGEKQQKKMRPVVLLLIVWIISITAAAGPSWQRKPSPFTEDTAALVITVKVTPSMTSSDIQPSRLERAAHKIRDLLALRPGAHTALIAYAGSAHRVMPLTTDNNIIETFARELAPNIMPVEGDVTGKALELANKQLTDSGKTGSILLITDNIAKDQVKTIETNRLDQGAPVHILAVTSNPDRSLKQAADFLGGSLTIVSPDDRDVKKLSDRIVTSFNASQQADKGEEWQDAGYWLLPLAAFLTLAWFRKGWIVEWD